MLFESGDYRHFLRGEFERSVAKNKRFSLRAFSARLGVPVSSLSEVLNGRQGLSRTSAARIAERLKLSREESEYFVALVESVHARSPLRRRQALKQAKTMAEQRENPLPLDAFATIADWFHLAILELSRTVGFQSDAAWIGRKLGISAGTAREASERLLRLGILKSEGGQLAASGKWLLTSPDEIPSACVRKFHSSILAKAARALGGQPVERRNFSSLVFAVNEQELPRAKKLVAEFNLKMSRLMTRDQTRDRLYCFSTQLFSLEESES